MAKCNELTPLPFKGLSSKRKSYAKRLEIVHNWYLLNVWNNFRHKESKHRKKLCKSWIEINKNGKRDTKMQAQ